MGNVPYQPWRWQYSSALDSRPEVSTRVFAGKKRGSIPGMGRPLIKTLFRYAVSLAKLQLTSSTLTNFSPASPPNGAETLFCKILSISLRTAAASRLALVAHFDATRSN